MQTEVPRTKIYAAVVTILFFSALTGASVLYDMRNNLQVSLDTERLNSEKLLSEKLLLDKEIVALKNNLSELSVNNIELTSQLNGAKNKVSQKETAIVNLQKENRTLKGLMRQVVQQ